MKKLILLAFFIVMVVACKDHTAPEKVTPLRSVTDAVELFNTVDDGTKVTVQIFNKGKLPGKVPEKSDKEKVIEKAAEPEKVTDKPIKDTGKTDKESIKKKDTKKIQVNTKKIAKENIKRTLIKTPIKKPKKD